MRGLQPFWRYYGGKNRAAKLYPAPEHDIIIEPFAGAAGYSCRYHWKQVILVDRSPIIAGIWRYLIKASAAEVLAIPDIPDGGTVDDLPAWVPQEARWLAGFWCNNGTVNPCKRPSKWVRENMVGGWQGWTHPCRQRIAKQMGSINRISVGRKQVLPESRTTKKNSAREQSGGGDIQDHATDIHGASRSLMEGGTFRPSIVASVRCAAGLHGDRRMPARLM